VSGREREHGQNTGASGRRPNSAGPRVDMRNGGKEADCSRGRRSSGRPGASSAIKLLKVYTSSIFFFLDHAKVLRIFVLRLRKDRYNTPSGALGVSKDLHRSLDPLKCTVR
jgi:hypothetical protein